GGTIDASAAGNFTLHLYGTGAGVTIDPSNILLVPQSVWTGSNARVQNDATSPVTISVPHNSTANIDLDVGMALTNGGNNQGFVKSGDGIMRLTNPANTADMTVSQGYLWVDNVAALGTGTLKLAE